jgi:type II secretory pathway component PulL
VYTVTLPPLPANRRDTALRAKLEDTVLIDIHQLQLLIKPLGKHRFSVATVAKSTLINIATYFKDAQQVERVIVPLTAYLLNFGEYALEDWLLWHDDTGAGAVPIQTNITAPTLTTQMLRRNETLAFTSTRHQGNHWQRWRIAIILFGLCCLVLLFNLGLTRRNGLIQTQQIEAEIARLFKQALPSTPLSSQPVAQLEQALGLQTTNIGGAAINSDAPLTLLQAMSYLPSDWPSGAVTQLSWQASRLSVTINKTVMKDIGIDEVQINNLSERLADKNITFILESQ